METFQFCKNRGSYKYRLGWIWKFTVRQSKHFFPFDLFPKNVGFRPKIYPPKFPMTIFSHLLYICNFPPIFAESLKLWNMFWKLIVGTWNRLAFGGQTPLLAIRSSCFPTYLLNPSDLTQQMSFSSTVSFLRYSSVTRIFFARYLRPTW